MIATLRAVTTRNPLAPAIAVINLKGGVGKTHTTWLLASACQESGRRVLLVDLDTQANLSSSFLEEDARMPGVEVLFDPAQEPTMTSLGRRTSFPNIDLLPANLHLAKFDLADRRAWESTDLHLALVEPLAELRGAYDLILLDCPPRLSVVSFAALCAADGVVIPLEAADWGAQGIMHVTAAIQDVQRRYNSRLSLLGYLVSRFKRARAYQQSYLKQLRAHFGPLAFDTVIPDLARFEQSVTDRIPITLHSPRSEEAEIARAFFREVERRIKVVGAVSPQRGRKNIRRTGIVTV
jgi:chromosome partitioning protein